MGRLMILLRPELLHASFRVWALLPGNNWRTRGSVLFVFPPLATESTDSVETAMEDAARLLGCAVHPTTSHSPGSTMDFPAGTEIVTWTPVLA
jgi:hypothetical protein